MKSSIIEGANVFISILVASLVFRQERFTGQKILGCLVGFAGVVLVNWTKDGLGAGMKWNGEGFEMCIRDRYRGGGERWEGKWAG